MKNRKIYIGFEPRTADAFAIAKHTTQKYLNSPIPVRGIVQSEMRKLGLYWREEYMKDGQRWDAISDAPCSTEFSNTRFLTPHLAAYESRTSEVGWALFMDSDMLVRSDLNELFDSLDPDKAMYCVKHNHEPDYDTKMDGQAQTRYARKNWSSVMVFNCDHPANRLLTLTMVNELPGRDLHRFCWLGDDEDLIGELPVEYNWLVGHSSPSVDPKIVHHTDGIPSMPGYEGTAYADEWHRALWEWAS